MGIVLKNALLADLDPPRVEVGELRIDGDRITARREQVAPQAGDEVVDCGGAVVLPGMVNGHTHLYSALAVGMPPPPRIPRNFLEILQLIWWRLDQALDAESVALSARIGAIAAVRCGTTTLIDHHASPNVIAGSLDMVESGLAAVGIRGVLCYETTDRHGRAGRDAGLEENRRYLHMCGERPDGQFAGLVGAHASFTLDDDALSAIAGLVDESGAGVHIHVAEDPCDEADARARQNRSASHGGGSDAAGCAGSTPEPLIDRLERHGLLTSNAVFAHGTHLSPAAVERVNRANLTMAHNARSNMNNAVGYAPVGSFRCPVMLGTDGIGADMFAEAKAGWMIARHERSGITPQDVVQMLANSARRASSALGVPLGSLTVRGAADVVLTDYVPFTPLATESLAGHLVFGMSSRNVRSVMCMGRWVLRDRILVVHDEAKSLAQAKVAAIALWARMDRIPV